MHRSGHVQQADRPTLTPFCDWLLISLRQFCSSDSARPGRPLSGREPRSNCGPRGATVAGRTGPTNDLQGKDAQMKSCVSSRESSRRNLYICTPFDCTPTNKKMRLAASRLPNRGAYRGPVQPIYRNRPSPCSGQGDLNMLITSRAFEMKPLLITAAHLAISNTGGQIIWRVVDVYREEIGTLEKSQVHQNSNPGERKPDHGVVSRNGLISPLPS
jgi:hypothetical protein